MKNYEFIFLLTSNTDRTTNIRTYAGHWYSGVSRVPDGLTTKIGKVISLIQTKINEGQICKKDTECLLIYNFQPGAALDNHLYCHIDMLIKPIADIHKTDQNSGKPLQLIVDGNTCQVANSTKSMIDLGLMTENEARVEGLEPPIVYGSYMDFKAVCCFAALPSYRPIPDFNVLFSGECDRGDSIQHSVAFDSWTEARNYLASRNELGRYILEINAAKEDYPHVLEAGLSKKLLKVINYFDMSIEITPYLKQENFSPLLGKKLHLEKIKETSPLASNESLKLALPPPLSI